MNSTADRDEIDEGTACWKRSGGLGGGRDREPCLPDAARADERHQPLRCQGQRQLVQLRRPSDEGRPGVGEARHRQHCLGPGRDQLRGVGGEFLAICRAQLPYQRRDVALYGPNRDVESLADLRVGQMIPQPCENFALTRGDAVLTDRCHGSQFSPIWSPRQLSDVRGPAGGVRSQSIRTQSGAVPWRIRGAPGCAQAPSTCTLDPRPR